MEGAKESFDGVGSFLLSFHVLNRAQNNSTSLLIATIPPGASK